MPNRAVAPNHSLIFIAPKQDGPAPYRYSEQQVSRALIRDHGASRLVGEFPGSAPKVGAKSGGEGAGGKGAGCTAALQEIRHGPTGNQRPHRPSTSYCAPLRASGAGKTESLTSVVAADAAGVAPAAPPLAIGPMPAEQVMPVVAPVRGQDTSTGASPQKAEQNEMFGVQDPEIVDAEEENAELRSFFAFKRASSGLKQPKNASPTESDEEEDEDEEDHGVVVEAGEVKAGKEVEEAPLQAPTEATPCFSDDEEEVL